MTKRQKTDWPQLLDRHVKSADGDEPIWKSRRFHGIPASGWEGRVHVDDVHGWVENNRIRLFVNQWCRDLGDPDRQPGTDDIYEIMIEADKDEPSETKKPFHLDRIARSIVRNGVTDPIILFIGKDGVPTLWDGNRRFYGTKHIMNGSSFKQPEREAAQWLPAYVLGSTGDAQQDAALKHAILTEMNFVQKDQIPWPAYVKAMEIHQQYEKRISHDPNDPALRKEVRVELAQEYGLSGWRAADRWIKMYDLAMEFKEYREEDREEDSADVDLKIQDKFEYFDELSKSAVHSRIRDKPDDKHEVFDWLSDGKFLAFTDVRKVPEILNNEAARQFANADPNVKRAIDQVIADDPARGTSTEAASAKIRSFAKWLEKFRWEDFRNLDEDAVDKLAQILKDIVKMAQGVKANQAEADDGA